MEAYFDCRETASVLGISRTAVTRLVHRGTLPCVWSAGRMLFRKEIVRRLAADVAYLKRSRKPKSISELEQDGQITLAANLLSGVKES